jgi:Fe-S cluster assembly ATP-binding protein
MINIHNLTVTVNDQSVLNGLDLTVPTGQVHAIMGPNGSGKSTLSHVLAGTPGYTVTGGSVTFQGLDVLAMPPHERALNGVFLAMQYPVELPGVPMNTFLKMMVGAARAHKNLPELPPLDFLRLVKSTAEKLGIGDEMLKRPVNVGASGGEKKRNDILQMCLLEPTLGILDETDSGLDIDALKIVAAGVNSLRGPGRSFIVITHYQRLLDYIVPDVVHVMQNGKIVQSGGPDLARALEQTGYAAYGGAA